MLQELEKLKKYISWIAEYKLHNAETYKFFKIFLFVFGKDSIIQNFPIRYIFIENFDLDMSRKSNISLIRLNSTKGRILIKKGCQI